MTFALASARRSFLRLDTHPVRTSATAASTPLDPVRGQRVIGRKVLVRAAKVLHRPARAFSLIEVIVASAILTIVMAGILSSALLVEKSDALARESRARTDWLAAKLAERACTLTGAAASSWSQVTTTNAAGQPDGTTLTEDVMASSLPSLYRVIATLAWTDSAGSAQTYTFQTLAYLP